MTNTVQNHSAINKPDNSKLVKVAAAALRSERLLECDHDTLDRVAVPDLFDYFVGESKHDQILDHLLAEVVVNAINFFFGKKAGNMFGQGIRTF